MRHDRSTAEGGEGPSEKLWTRMPTPANVLDDADCFRVEGLLLSLSHTHIEGEREIVCVCERETERFCV